MGTTDPRLVDKARLLTALGMHPRVARDDIGPWGVFLDAASAAGLDTRDVTVEHEAVHGGMTLTAWGPREAVEEALEAPGLLLELQARAGTSATSGLDAVGAWRRHGPEGKTVGWCARGALSPALVATWTRPPLDLDELRELRRATDGAAAGTTEATWSRGALPAAAAWEDRLGEVEPEMASIVEELLGVSRELLVLEHQDRAGAVTASGVRLVPAEGKSTRAQLLALLFTEQPETRDVELAAVQGALGAPLAIDVLATDDGPRLLLHLPGARGPSPRK